MSPADTTPKVLDIVGLQAELDAFARRVESDPSIGTASVLTSAQSLLGRIAACVPATGERSEGGRWQAVSASTESGEQHISAWCEQPCAEAFIGGALGSVMVQVGARSWALRDGRRMYSDIRPVLAKGPEDEAFFASLKERGERFFEEHAPGKASAPLATCPRCNWQNENGAICRICGSLETLFEPRR